MPRIITTPLSLLKEFGPRLPVPKDGERFVPAGKRAGEVPQGKAKCLVGTPTSAADYPEEHEYDPSTQELRVGKGRFGGVRREVWEYGVSGLQVVDSWLGYRMKKRSGKKSSPLDDIRPDSWRFAGFGTSLGAGRDGDRLPALAALFEEWMAADHLPAAAFPEPSGEERQGPGAGGRSQGAFTFSRT